MKDRICQEYRRSLQQKNGGAATGHPSAFEPADQAKAWAKMATEKVINLIFTLYATNHRSRFVRPQRLATPGGTCSHITAALPLLTFFFALSLYHQPQGQVCPAIKARHSCFPALLSRSTSNLSYDPAQIQPATWLSTSLSHGYIPLRQTRGHGPAWVLLLWLC